MFYKIVNGLVDIPADKYLTANKRQTRAGGKNSYRQPSTRTDTLNQSFFPSTIRLWNALPATMAEAPDLAHFKQELSKLKF
jgi:hypothetical protein